MPAEFELPRSSSGWTRKYGHSRSKPGRQRTTGPPIQRLGVVKGWPMQKELYLYNYSIKYSSSVVLKLALQNAPPPHKW